MFVGRALGAEVGSCTRSPEPAVRKVFPSLPRPALPPPVPSSPPPGRAAIPKAPCPAEQHSSARWCCDVPQPRSTARPRAALGHGHRHRALPSPLVSPFTIVIIIITIYIFPMKHKRCPKAESRAAPGVGAEMLAALRYGGGSASAPRVAPARPARSSAGAAARQAASARQHCPLLAKRRAERGGPDCRALSSPAPSRSGSVPRRRGAAGASQAAPCAPSGRCRFSRCCTEVSLQSSRVLREPTAPQEAPHVWECSWSVSGISPANAALVMEQMWGRYWVSSCW